MHRAILALLFAPALSACASLGVEPALDHIAGATGAADGAANGTTRLCAARDARGACTEWQQHETVEARWLRETNDERQRQQAYRSGEPFFPSDVPGESADERVRRMDEERRRQEAFGKGEPFFPDHRPGESSEGYVRRMDEERRRQEAYRKNEPFFPDTSGR
jgi:hypothetical protein